MKKVYPRDQKERVLRKLLELGGWDRDAFGYPGRSM